MLSLKLPQFISDAISLTSHATHLVDWAAREFKGIGP